MSLASWQGPPEDPPQHQLRLYQPTDADGSATLSHRSRLTDLYRRHVLPVVLKPKRSSPDTLKEYRTSLEYWCDLAGDPPLERITDATCAAFVGALAAVKNRKGKPLRGNTVRKHCTNLQFILDQALPRSRERLSRRQALGLLTDVPYFERPALEEKPAVDQFTLDEIGAILAHCDAAQRPELEGITPRAYWHSRYLWDLNVGARNGTTMLLEYRMLGSDGGVKYLDAPAEICKGRRGRRFFLNDAACLAIESIRTPRERIFPWPFWPTNEATLYREHRKILAAAGIPKERRFGFHGVRKLHITLMARMNPLAAQQSAGHASMRTTQEHYVLPALLAETLAKLPQPPPSKQ